MRLAAVLCLAACFIAAGCGGSSSAQEEPDASTLEELWHAPGEDVAVVPGAADFGPGDVRYPFLVIDGQGRSATIKAGDEGLKTFAISPLNFSELIDKHPSLAKALLKALCARIRSLEQTPVDQL